MVRKLAYLLVILAVLTAVGELCGLLLPTLSWPFTVSREMSMLNIVCTDQNNGGLLTPQGKFLFSTSRFRPLRSRYSSGSGSC